MHSLSWVPDPQWLGTPEVPALSEVDWSRLSNLTFGGTAKALMLDHRQEKVVDDFHYLLLSCLLVMKLSQAC